MNECPITTRFSNNNEYISICLYSTLLHIQSYESIHLDLVVGVVEEWLDVVKLNHQMGHHLLPKKQVLERVAGKVERPEGFVASGVSEEERLCFQLVLILQKSWGGGTQ